MDGKSFGVTCAADKCDCSFEYAGPWEVGDIACCGACGHQLVKIHLTTANAWADPKTGEIYGELKLPPSFSY
jgi:hypothetical protein